MVNTIQTKITLEGAEQIKEQLTELGEAGKTALNQIKDAADASNFDGLAKAFDTVKGLGSQFSDGLRNLKNDLSPVIDGVKEAGKVLGITFGGGIIGAAAALGTFAGKSADAIESTSNLAAQAGTTVEEMSALKSGLSAAGANTGTLDTSFRHLAVTISNVLPVVQKALRDAGLIEAQNNLNVTQAATSLAQLRQNAEQLAEANQGIRIPDINKQIDADRLAALQLEAAYNQVAEAELRLAQAQAAQEEAARNSIINIIAYVKALANGFSTAAIDVNASTENIVKGIVALAGGAATALSGLTGSFQDLANATPDVSKVLFLLADVLKNTESETQKMAIASALLGRGITEDFVDALSQGSEALKSFIDQQRALGLVLTANDKLLAHDYHSAFNTFISDLKIIATQIGAVFLPALTGTFRVLTDLLVANRQKILDFAASIRDTIVPILVDFLNLLSGNTEAISNQWILDWADGIKTFAKDIETAYQNVIKPVFDALMNGLDDVAKTVNALFGTNISGSDLGIGLLIGQVTGLNKALLDLVPVIATIGQLFIGLATVGGWPALIVAAFAEVVLAMQAYGPQLAAIFQPVVDIVKSINAWLYKGLSAAQQLAATTAQSSAPGLATGGLFRGKPGIDTNLAWLTDYEFVMNPAAVKKYGVGFMHMINSLRLPIDQLRGFSLGGLVESVNQSLAIPRFAAGGLNVNTLVPVRASGPTKSFHLHIGRQVFGPLMADDEVAGAMIRYATKRSAASAGRSPSRVR